MKKVFIKKISRKEFAWGALIAFLVMQIFRIDKTNPPTIPSKDFLTIVAPPDDIASLLKNACYDCHSHSSDYPWYTNVAPVSWWVKGHIKEGRRKLNFAEWGDYSDKRKTHKLEECVEMMAEGRMPLKTYTWAHSEARLSNEQSQRLQDWFGSL